MALAGPEPHPSLRPRLDPGFALEIRQTPTLGPRRGLPITITAA